jgi:hypothetical protein
LDRAPPNVTQSSDRSTTTNKQTRTKNNTPNEKILKKSVLKDRAHCYGQEGARNTENGATIEKKQLSEDLCYKRDKRTISFIYFNLEN